MAFKDTGKTPVEPEVAILWIWIPLTSCNLKSLEKVCADLIGDSMGKILKVKVPVLMPTKTLRFTIRKISYGKDSKTWDHFQMKIHKQLTDLHSLSGIIMQFTSISIKPGVKAEVSYHRRCLNQPFKYITDGLKKVY